MRRLLIAVVVTMAACAHHRPAPAPGGEPPPSPATAPASAPGAATWLCRPDRPTDPCRSADLSATEIRADGSRVVVPHRRAEHPAVDCFYVYPTVDLELVPGNHEDLGDARRMLATTLAQAARFTEACALWVPLYRQVTLGTYLQPKDRLERGLAFAFSDVARAFDEYLVAARAEPARKIVLVGHSQGADMVVRLLRRYFADDPGMRARLLVAMPIGGDVDVLAGETRGGSVKNVPMCTRPDETGCIVAYRTYSAGDRVDPALWAPPAGHETVCVDPTSLDGSGPVGPHRFSRAYFAIWPELRSFMRGIDGVTTPFVLFRDFYAARCVRGASGMAWLEATVAAADRADGDARRSPVDLRDRRFRIGNLGLHILDLQLAQGDLVDMVTRRANALSLRQGEPRDSFGR